MIIDNLKKKFSNNNILITGHTGFKGSWLASILGYLGCNIIGVSNKVLTNPSHYKSIKSIFNNEYFVDLRDKNEFKKILSKHRPKFIFHLAAQSLVLKSYDDPYETYTTNFISTLNLLENLRVLNFPTNVILITSDKSYKNLEKKNGYKEESQLGGDDPYSGSKASTEMMIQSYVKSYFSKNKIVKIAVARAGNVIGGGDWSNDRIIPDAIKSWFTKNILFIRNPSATRPWQHVLEPLFGYLFLSYYLSNNKIKNGDIFNFGPKRINNKTVLEIITILNKKIFKEIKYLKIIQKKTSHKKKETTLLFLNSSKAASLLNWKCVLTLNETMQLIYEWYYNYYSKEKVDVMKLTFKQINFYISKINDRL